MNKEKVEAVSVDKKSKTLEAQKARSQEKLIRESRDQYRDFLDSINRSSDRDIDRAMSRM